MTSSHRLSPSTYGRLMWRETRSSGGRFLFFVICLAIGIAAVVCVAGLTRNLDRRIRDEARELLAADMTVSGPQRLSPEIEDFLQERPELQITHIQELVTMVVQPHLGEGAGASQLVELKVIDGDYPFYGNLEVEPPSDLRELLTEQGLVVAPDLMARLDLGFGDLLRVGGRDFFITGQVLHEPDRIATPFTLGPRVFVSAAGFDRTDLEQMGSRIIYRALVRLPAGSDPQMVEKLADELRQIVGKGGPFRVQTYVDSQEELRQALERAANFLGLVALLSLLLGGLGIAQATRAWLVDRMDDIAVLRCLGVRPGEVLGLYLGQSTFLALAGSLIGIVIGVLIQALLPRLFPEILGDVALHLWQPSVFLRGLALGLAVAMLSSLRSLWTIRSVPPLRALRKDVEPLKSGRLATLLIFGLLATGIWTVASVQGGSTVRGLQFTLGLTLVSAVLTLVALLIMRSLAPLARNFRSLWLRHGLLALARPGAATLSAVVSLGVGVLLILGLQLVKNRLEDQLRNELPPDSPTAFLVNIQPRQWPQIEEMLASSGAERIDSVPFVTARLRAIDGRPIAELVDGEMEDDRRWAITREQRLTYMDSLPEDNRIIAGDLWHRPDEDEVSVEEEFARDMGVEVGSRLRFDIQGVPRELLVTSIRSVEWESFGINFFLVAEPGVLDDAPHQRVATARLPRAEEQSIQDRLATMFPNVTLLRIREILERIAAVLGYLANGVGFIGAFTALAGVVILAGGVSADSVRRRQHIALLKTLGMTQKSISAMLAVEFAIVGTVAGLIGAIGGSVLAWAVVTRGLEIEWQLQPVTLVAAVGITLVLTTATGILSSRKALRQPPAAVLRGD